MSLKRRVTAELFWIKIETLYADKSDMAATFSYFTLLLKVETMSCDGNLKVK